MVYSNHEMRFPWQTAEEDELETTAPTNEGEPNEPEEGDGTPATPSIEIDYDKISEGVFRRQQEAEAARLRAEAEKKEMEQAQAAAEKGRPDVAALRKQMAALSQEAMLEADPDKAAQANELAIRIAKLEVGAEVEQRFKEQYEPRMSAVDQSLERDSLTKFSSGMSDEEKKILSEYISGKNPSGKPINPRLLDDPMIGELVGSHVRLAYRESLKQERPVPGVENAFGSGVANLTADGKEMMSDLERLRKELSAEQGQEIKIDYQKVARRIA